MSAFGNGYNPDNELDGFTPGNAASAEFDLGNMDFSGIAPDTGFKPLDAGTYDAIVEDCVYSVSRKGAGNPQWVWTFRCTIPETGKTQRVNHYTPFIPDQLGRFVAIVKVVAPDFNLAGVDVTTQAAEMKGRACKVRVGVETRDDGSKSNKVQRVFAPEDNGSAASFI